MELDYNKLLDMVSEMGYRLMKSGAEIYRVEESIQRLLQSYGAPRGEVFAIPNCLMVSLTSPDGRPVTQIRRMPTHGTDIYLLEKYNGLCRRLCRETPAFEEALEQMEAITRTHRVYSLPTQLAAHFLGCGMFSLFYGGTPADGLCGGLCGMVIGLCMALMTRLGANLFFRTIAGGAASALAAVALTRLGVGQNQDADGPGARHRHDQRHAGHHGRRYGGGHQQGGGGAAHRRGHRSGHRPGPGPDPDGDGRRAMREALLYLLPCVYAFLACIGFSMLFNIHGAGMLICAGGGALGWLCYLLTGPLVGNDIIQSFFAALVISAWSEVMARLRKCPVTSYLLVALFPLVPGGGIYYTMEHALNGDTELFLDTLMHTLGLAGALAVGVLLVASVVRLFTTYQSRRRG